MFFVEQGEMVQRRRGQAAVRLLNTPARCRLGDAGTFCLVRRVSVLHWKGVISTAAFSFAFPLL